MSGLLEKDPHTRLGASSWSSLTDHPFFASLDFRLLENKQCTPVFHPSSEKSNFDAVYELEELLLEQAPLEGRARKSVKRHPQMQQGNKDGSDLRSKKEFPRHRGRYDEEDREEEILEMINQYFEPYDYTRFDTPSHSVTMLTNRSQGNSHVLAKLTNEIRRLSLNDTTTPGSTPPNVPNTPISRQSTSQDSSRSVPPIPPMPTSYRSETSPSPTSDSDRGHPKSQRHPTPPPQQPVSSAPSPSQSSIPFTIRLPPAVARVAGKENKKNSMLGGFYPPPVTNPPTSHQTSPQKDPVKGGIMLWGKKERDTRSEKWESGVIGRERARVVVDSGYKRYYLT